MAKKKDTSTRVLKDHRKIGKKFVPPFLSQIGELTETPWLSSIFPEILWLGLLNESLGLRAGSNIAADTAKAVRECTKPDNQLWFCRLGDYDTLDQSERNTFREKLTTKELLWPLCTALHPLYEYYPAFPMRFLFTDVIRDQLNGKSNLEEFKRVVRKLRDKYDKPGTLMQANAIYIAFATERMKVFKGLALANFPAIADFPNTEESKKVASALRPALMSLFAFEGTKSTSTWNQDFWLRGFELGECEF